MGLHEARRCTQRRCRGRRDASLKRRQRQCCTLAALTALTTAAGAGGGSGFRRPSEAELLEAPTLDVPSPERSQRSERRPGKLTPRLSDSHGPTATPETGRPSAARCGTSRVHVAGQSQSSVTSPSSKAYFTDYMQVILSEPCIRGALKNVHVAFAFLDEVSGTLVRIASQLLRCFFSVQGARVEGFSQKASQTGTADVHIYATRTLLQCFFAQCDHRGQGLCDGQVSAPGLSALLTRSPPQASI